MTDKGKLSGQEAAAAFLIWSSQQRTNQQIADQTRQLSTAQRYIILQDGGGERTIINVRGDTGGAPGRWVQADLDGRWYEWSHHDGAYVYTDGRPPPPPEEHWWEAILTTVLIAIISGGIALFFMPIYGIYLLATDKPERKTAAMCLILPISLLLSVLLLVALIKSSSPS